MTMFHESLRKWVAWVGMSVSLCAVACGGGDDSPGGVSLDGDSVETDLPPLAAVGPCVEAEVKPCRVDLGEIGGQPNCFVGVQICTDGVWSACVEEEELDDQVVASEDTAH